METEITTWLEFLSKKKAIVEQILVSEEINKSEIQSRGVDSYYTNQAVAGDFITSRSRDKRKIYLHYQCVYGHQTWQLKVIKMLIKMVTYLDKLLPRKSHDAIATRFREITWQTKNISPLSQSLWSQNLAGWWLALSDYYS